MKKETGLKLSLLAGDIVLLYVALFLTLIIRNNTISIPSSTELGVFLYHFSILHIFFIIFLFALDFYETNFLRKISKFFANLCAFAFAALFLGIAYFYFRSELTFTPKTILVLDIGIFILLFCFWRYFFSRVLMRNFKEKMIIIGMPDNLNGAMQNILGSYQVVAFFLPNNLFRAHSHASANIISHIDELERVAKQEKVTLAVFTDEVYENKALAEQLLFRLPKQITFLHYYEFYELMTKRIPLDALNEIWFLEEVSRRESKTYVMIKRLFDLLLALVFFAALLVLFPFIAIAITLDSPGPVFYSQERVGKNRKIFTLYKFRTMQHGNGQEKMIWRENKKGQITRVGTFLRRFHLDELPQSVSILKGDLSFVGPRPEWVPIAEMFEKEIPFYHQRYNTQVGFTGWAAINYPPSNSLESAKEKFEYDLYYIKNRSLFLDLEIILKTVRLILK